MSKAPKLKKASKSGATVAVRTPAAKLETPIAATVSDPNWVDIGALTDVPVRGARLVKTDAGCLALFRTAEDKAYAINDKCPHKGGPLSQGIVHGNTVTCPLHNWVISLETGEAQGADKGRVKTIPLQITNGRILLNVPVRKPQLVG
jgi:nitrite reductase (NADH) small subunit